MPKKDRPYYYVPVPGSRELVTSSRQDDPELLQIEQEASGPGPQPLREYKGELLGGARTSDGVLVPASVLDRLARDQEPMEQAVYLHLFRLSYGEGLNFCRAGKAELGSRAGLSPRRLNVALNGLVKKGHIKPLHRNTSGTLYRVYLPSEVYADESHHEKQTSGKAPAKKTPPKKTPQKKAGPKKTKPKAQGRAQASPAPGPAKSEKIKPATKERPLESPLNEERFADVSGAPVKGPSISELAAAFFNARGLEPGDRDRQMAVTILTELLEDGFSRHEVARAIQWYAKNHPEEGNLDRLPYYMSEALDAGPTD